MGIFTVRGIPWLLPQNFNHLVKFRSFAGALLAQLVECQTLDCKVVGSNHTIGAVLCSTQENVPTEKLLTGHGRKA